MKNMFFNIKLQSEEIMVKKVIRNFWHLWFTKEYYIWNNYHKNYSKESQRNY